MYNCSLEEELQDLIDKLAGGQTAGSAAAMPRPSMYYWGGTRLKGTVTGRFEVCSGAGPKFSP